MRPSIAFCFLSICMQLKLHVCDRICLKNQYTILWSNGSVKNCLYCEKCHPGFGLSPVCGSSIVYPPKNIDCNPCPSGTFSDKDDSAPCQNCQECVANEIVVSQCTGFSDRNCSGTCTKGYYFSKNVPHNCQKCSYCCNDGKDEMQLECINQGLNATNQHCSLRLDKKCGPEPTPITTVSPAPITTVTCTPAPVTAPSSHHGEPRNNGSSNTIITIAIVLGVLFGVLLVGAVYKWRKVRTTRAGGHDPPPSERAENQTPGNQVDIPQVTQPRLQALCNQGFSSNSNPVTPQASPGGTPCPTDDELDDSVSTDAVGPHNTRSVKRQTDKDGAEGRQRRRSRGGSSQSFIIKRSGAEECEPFALQDPDGAQESFRIVEHPTHQTHINEGSRVVFKCKAEGMKKISYQWLKDGTKMQGKNSCTLVFDSVKVRDFGWYSCEVRCADGQYRSECVESSAAELDVFPPDGMRFRYLEEAFQQSLDTRQNVEKLLMRENPGVGGWKQVAFKWKMNEFAIDSLERSHEGGKGVISYLKATYPELTVYEFCKTLKEPNIKRFDIIKQLSSHLVSVPQEQTA